MFWARLLVILLLASPAGAEITLELPLEGYYRPGRYMPVRYTASASAPHLTIAGNGVTPAEIELSAGRAQGIAPILTWDTTLRELHGQVQGERARTSTALRALAPDQALVGFTSSDASAVRQLFPDRTIIPVRLSAADLVNSPPAAWEALDALVVDAAVAAQWKPETIHSLLASGVIVAVQTPVAPDAHWPWRQEGPFFILQHRPIGPAISTAYPVLFDPVQGWQADWPAAFRYRIFLYALLFAILLLGLVVMRPRLTPLWAVLLSIGTVLALGVWWHGRAAVLRREGDVAILSERLRQSDTWTYLASATSAAADWPWAGLVRPQFEQQTDRQITGLLLRCSSTGQPVSFAWRSVPGVKLAFLSRSLSPRDAHTEPVQPAQGNPLASLARRIYLRPGSQILGQLSADSHVPTDTVQIWPTLVIDQMNQ